MFNANVENVLDKITEGKKNIEESKKGSEYAMYIAAASVNQIGKLSISVFENTFNNKYDFTKGFQSSETKFENTYNQSSTSQSDYYTSKEEDSYAELKKKNKQSKYMTKH